MRYSLFFALIPSLFASMEVYVTDYMEAQVVRIKPLRGVKTNRAVVYVARGEYEPVSFAIRPTVRMEAVFITANDLVSPQGRISRKNIKVTSVERFHGGDRNILMELGRKWDMPAYRKELFWLIIHIPEDAKPGTYKGSAYVTSAGKRVGELKLEVNVLPFRLEDPPYAIGFNYSYVKDTGLMRAHLRDMREHGMTSVGPLYNFHLPIYDDDVSQIREFIKLYREVGFPEPMYFAVSLRLFAQGAGALAGYGSVDSRRFQLKFIQVMRKMWRVFREEQRPVVFSIGDEFTNAALIGIKKGEKLARLCYEELPEIPVTSDMNGYLEVMTLSPYLNVAAFNNGWDGIDRHNKGRRLINKDFILELQKKTGTIPWFVNHGRGRFAFGFFFWKIAKYGVKGKIEWYYNLGRNERGSVVRTEVEPSPLTGEPLYHIYPTILYERCREGVDDLKYVLKLESLLSKLKGNNAEEVVEARALVKKIRDSIIDNWTAYREGGEYWESSQFHQFRRSIQDSILKLLKLAG